MSTGLISAERGLRTRLSYVIAALRLEVALIRYCSVLKRAAYDRDQPRVPAGSSDGGRWTSGGGGAATVSPAALDVSQQYSVYLPDEEVDGGHTISTHVIGLGKDQLQIDRVISERVEIFGVESGPFSEGACFSVESANDLINRALAANTASVDLVASGAADEQKIDLRLGSVTGREAHTNGYEDPNIRKTFAVRVIIRHDRRSPRGYRVFTAFPINIKPDGGEDTP